VPYFTIIVPSGTAIGCTVDARIGATPVRVTWLSEETLRIEPDDVVGSLLPCREWSRNDRTGTTNPSI
jgi:hypothetical protein